MEIKSFFKNAFGDMKENAKAQHEVDKAEFKAVKAEAKANFEENRGRNTYAKAKADAKKIVGRCTYGSFGKKRRNAERA